MAENEEIMGLTDYELSKLEVDYEKHKQYSDYEVAQAVANLMSDEDFAKYSEYQIPTVDTTTKTEVSPEVKQMTVQEYFKMLKERRENFINSYIDYQNEQYFNKYGYYMNGQQKRNMKRKVAKDYDKGKFNSTLNG